MKTALTLTLLATLAASGCSTTPKSEEPEPSMLESIPFVYRPDIQQGNIVTREQLQRLKPGMTKQQVRFLLGTPRMVDAFHQNQWSYIYSMKKSREERVQQDITVHFEEDKVTKVEGDNEAGPENVTAIESKESLISVPDYTAQKKGFVERILNSVGVEVQEDPVEK